MSSVEQVEALPRTRQRRWHAHLRCHRTPFLYVGAGLSYVAIGVFYTPFMMSWFVAFGWLLLWACGIPALGRALRR